MKQGVGKWALSALAVAAGLALFLLGMKYGDKLEERILSRLSRHRSDNTQSKH